MNLIKTMQRATIMAKPSKVVNNSFFIAYSSFFLPQNDPILNNLYWMAGCAPVEIHASPGENSRVTGGKESTANFVLFPRNLLR
jgi:hypothetical protein